MSFMELSFEIQGGQRLSRIFPIMRDDVSDLTSPMRQSADLILHTNESVFQREGPGWQFLAPKTVSQRIQLGYPGEHPILVRSGRLMRSLSQKNAEGNIYEVDKQSMRVGSLLRVGGWNLAMIHQEGTGRIPARPIIGLDIGNLRRNLSRIWENWLYHVPYEAERKAARRQAFELEQLYEYSVKVG
jgi:phage gpG-like protein